MTRVPTRGALPVLLPDVTDGWDQRLGGPRCQTEAASAESGGKRELYLRKNVRPLTRFRPALTMRAPFPFRTLRRRTRTP